MGDVLESEAVTAERLLKPWCAIDEKHGIFDVVFLAEFTEENLGNTEVLRRTKFHVEEFVCLGIDSGVQPVALVVDLDHGFVDRNVIRALALSGL